MFIYVILFHCFVRLSITSDSTGSHLAAVDYGGYLYTSSDYGVTWITRTSSGARAWYVNYYYFVFIVVFTLFYCFARLGITSDSTGSYLAAVENGGYLYTSSDYGATWITRTSAGAHSW